MVTMNDGFALIPNRIISDNNITDIDKLVFGVVYGLCSVQGYAWASNKYISELLGKSERTITRSLSNLEKNGYINIKLLKRKDFENVKNMQRKIFLTGKGVLNSVSESVLKSVIDRQKCLSEIDKNVQYNINNNINNNSDTALSDDKSVSAHDCSNEQSIALLSSLKGKKRNCKDTLTYRIYNLYRDKINSDSGDVLVNWAQLGAQVKRLKKLYSDSTILAAVQDALNDSFFDKTKSLHAILACSVINKYLIKRHEEEKQLQVTKVKKEELKDVDISEEEALEIFNKAVRKQKLKEKLEKIEKEARK